MLILFETPAGYAIFKANEKKLKKVENIFEEFTSAEKASEVCVTLFPMLVSHIPPDSFIFITTQL